MDEFLRDFLMETGEHAATTHVLTFRAGSRGIKALPLDVVKRIETARSAEIRRSAGRLVLRRGDGLHVLLPLVAASAGRNPEQPVLIVEICGHTFGLLVDEIVDIADAATGVTIVRTSPAASGERLARTPATHGAGPS